VLQEGRPAYRVLENKLSSVQCHEQLIENVSQRRQCPTQQRHKPREVGLGPKLKHESCGGYQRYHHACVHLVSFNSPKLFGVCACKLFFIHSDLLHRAVSQIMKALQQYSK